jgi:hypothetical protein
MMPERELVATGMKPGADQHTRTKQEQEMQILGGKPARQMKSPAAQKSGVGNWDWRWDPARERTQENQGRTPALITGNRIEKRSLVAGKSDPRAGMKNGKNELCCEGRRTWGWRRRPGRKQNNEPKSDRVSCRRSARLGSRKEKSCTDSTGCSWKTRSVRNKKGRTKNRSPAVARQAQDLTAWEKKRSCEQAFMDGMGQEPKQQNCEERNCAMKNQIENHSTKSLEQRQEGMKHMNNNQKFYSITTEQDSHETRKSPSSLPYLIFENKNWVFGTLILI